MGGTRTFHRMASAIEEAGYEIRDTIMWIYGSGFPKSHNHFGIEGYGTALKPAHEPITLAMKPIDGTFKQNAEKWGQAGINIDACRIGNPEDKRAACTRSGGIWTKGEIVDAPHDGKGRWPANVIFDEEAARMLDEQQDKVSRFFYCAKASSSERNGGLEGMPLHIAPKTGSEKRITVGGSKDIALPRQNNHPTVKPLKLMEYLIKLIMPPKDGILLDPFAGSGTTILAAHRLGLKAIGIEKQPDYAEIARARLSAAQSQKNASPELF